jgi:catechol 2,3-dioxygenase-like lactoylglutathione lyase family enzyme
MERVTGVGGVFFRTRDAAALVAWYEEHLGVLVREGYVIFPGKPAHALGAIRGRHGLLAGGEAVDGQLHGA